jgi:hypothetical protein
MTEQIKRVIAKGKPLSVIKGLITKELLRLDKAKFEADIRAEYDELFPRRRLMTDDEYINSCENIISDGYDIIENGERLFYDVIDIDYSEDENYVTFEEYKDETKVITEAVYEDEFVDDINVGRKLVSAETTEPVRPYTQIEVTDEMIQAELDKLGYVPKDKREAQKYLNDTDWYVVRYAEQGVEIPQEVLDKRQECREVL